MKTIQEVLQNENSDARLSVGDRWLVKKNGVWIVYERKYAQKKTRVLIETDSEQIAVKILMEES